MRWQPMRWFYDAVTVHQACFRRLVVEAGVARKAKAAGIWGEAKNDDTSSNRDIPASF